MSTQYDFRIDDTVQAKDGREGKVSWVPKEYGEGSFVMVMFSPRSGCSFWPQDLTVVRRAKQRAPKKAAEKTLGQMHWEKQRKNNPSLLPWTKLSEEVRARTERYAIHGCECGYCKKDDHGRIDSHSLVSYVSALW